MKRKMHIICSKYLKALLYRVLFTFLLFPIGLQAAPGSVNQTIPYTARISTSESDLLADGDYRMRFLLYQELSGGTPFYEQVQDGIAEYNTETCPITPVVNGKIDIALGSCNPLSLSDLNKTEMYLEIQLDLNEDGTYEEIFRPRKLVGSRLSSISTTQLTANTEGNENTLRINGDGNLVFNTASTAGNLQLGGSGTPSYRLSLGGSNVGIDDISGSVIGFFTSGLERLRLTDAGRLGILTDAPQVALDINATDAVRFPVGNTSQRPSGSSGMTRFNTTEGRFEVYSGTQWRGIAYGDEGIVTASGIVDEDFVVGSGFAPDTSGGFGRAVTNFAIYPDGRILAVGNFTSYQGVSANRIIRLNPDGSRDTTFNMGTGFNSNTNGLLLLPNGQILVQSGSSTQYNGQSFPNYLIRLNPDGSRDTSFTPPANFLALSPHIARQSDGKLIVGGVYTGGVDPINTARLVRLNANGTLDPTFDGSGFQGISGISIFRIQPDGKIVVGGTLTSYKGVPTNGIIRLNSNGSRDSSFVIGTGFTGDMYGRTVGDMEIQPDNKILVSGKFTQYNGVATRGVVRLNSNGTLDSSFAIDPVVVWGSEPMILDVTRIVLQQDGKVVAVGGFVDSASQTSFFGVRFNTNGTVDSTYDTGSFSSNIFAAEIQYDNKILFGGWFGLYNGESRGGITRVK